jgi:hypothetical protein
MAQKDNEAGNNKAARYQRTFNRHLSNRPNSRRTAEGSPSIAVSKIAERVGPKAAAIRQKTNGQEGRNDREKTTTGSQKDHVITNANE